MSGLRLLSMALASCLLLAVSTLSASAEKVMQRFSDLSFGGKESTDPISPNRFYEVNDLIYSRLVRQGENGEPAPELATSWTPSADGTEWTLKLQPDVKFHDGSPFTAEDVKYTLERINDPALESPVAAVLGIIKRVDVIDPLTVKVVLSSPHSGLPLLLLDYRVRIIRNGSGPTIEQAPIGTGPFKVETYDPEGRTILVANKDYWEGAPKLDKIVFTAIPDSEARQQAMLAGQLDLVTPTTEQAAAFETDKSFVVQRFPAGGWNGVVFRTDVAPYTDWRVRKALRIAVDRSDFLKLMLGEGGGVITCDTPVKEGDPFRNSFDCLPDVEGAKKLLAEAGFPNGIDVELHTSDVEPGMVRFAEIYQQQVAKAGIRVKITLSPSDGYWDDVWMKMPAVVTSWSQRPADQILNEAYRTGSSWNESGFANANFDALLDKARSSLDFAASRQAYVDAQRLLFEEGGVLIPFQQNGIRVLSARVTGIPAKDEDEIRWHLVDVAQ